MDFKFGISLGIQVIGFAFVYLKPYFAERGKNLATKQDIGEITSIVEGIKTELAQKTEELKSDLL